MKIVSICADATSSSQDITFILQDPISQSVFEKLQSMMTSLPVRLELRTDQMLNVTTDDPNLVDGSFVERVNDSLQHAEKEVEEEKEMEQRARDAMLKQLSERTGVEVVENY